MKIELLITQNTSNPESHLIRVDIDAKTVCYQVIDTADLYKIETRLQNELLYLREYINAQQNKSKRRNK